MSWRRNGGMPDPRSAFHSATLSTESNADLISDDWWWPETKTGDKIGT